MSQGQSSISYRTQGYRDYIDISQAAYQAFKALQIDVNSTNLTHLHFTVHSPIKDQVQLINFNSKDFEQINVENLVVTFNFQLNNQTHKYGLINISNKIDAIEKLIEPTCIEQIHFTVNKEKANMLKNIDNCNWPIFFAFMTLGREFTKKNYLSQKPRALDSKMARIPKPNEIEKLWVNLFKGPIKNIIVINLMCGLEKIGTTKIKI